MKVKRRAKEYLRTDDDLTEVKVLRFCSLQSVKTSKKKKEREREGPLGLFRAPISLDVSASGRQRVPRWRHDLGRIPRNRWFRKIGLRSSGFSSFGRSSNDFLNDWMLYVISWSDNGFLCCRERILNYCFFFFFFWFGSLVNPQLSLGDLSCDVNTPFGYYCNLDCRNLFLHFLF